MAVVNTAATRGRWLVRPVLTRARFIPARAGNTGGRAADSGHVRFIPARAGNTAFPCLPRYAGTVHPRAGGEHSRASCCAAAWVGSSPRGRGTHDTLETVDDPPRFIPARAGNTHNAKGIRHASPVHPRAGGEHVWNATRTAGISGSSPRGRGTRLCDRGRRGVERFIPARAGNTGFGRASHPHRPVHPRAGGEHGGKVQLPDVPYGSSPRGRGTRQPRARGRHPQRFIPARAGNTGWSTKCRAPRSVHPRAGGEHVHFSAPHVPFTGSSPRGRGTLVDDVRDPDGHRFIPARAGNTRRRSESSAPCTVHPRAGGEHRQRHDRRPHLPGSSPRGRGTLARDGGPEARDRFIPARAGNTALRRAGR